MPQLSVPPQPSLIEPHAAPCAVHVVGTHTHALPWQVSPEPHVPQLSMPPQPSEMEPQLAPAARHVVG